MDEIYDYTLPHEAGGKIERNENHRPISSDQKHKLRLTTEVKDVRWPYGKIRQPFNQGEDTSKYNTENY